MEKLSFKRFKRLRQSPALRSLVKEIELSVDDLIMPLFFDETITNALPVSSMPGVCRYPLADMENVLAEVAEVGIKAVLLFGIPEHRDCDGSDTWKPEGFFASMLRRAKAAAPDLLVISDNCFCEYTEHGHCGVLDGDCIDNDESLKNLQAQAVLAARAGADMIAPSAMLDGQIAAIRTALDEAGYVNLPIMAYSAKFASAFYGPFRDAVDSTLQGDRATYQIDYRSPGQALLESQQDESEGADILMVKPGLPYIDVLSDIARSSRLPLAVYQVSGEYSMIKMAGDAGAVDLRATVLESMYAFKRAGASMIITYFALDVARWLKARDSSLFKG